jgi:ABC-type nitrate/sulfonate/bicarbonate transport system permease component
MRTFRSGAVSTWFPILVVAIWELSEGSVFFPPPSAIWERAVEEVDLGWLSANLAPTLAVFSVGYLSGLLLGVALGALVGINRWIYDLVLPSLVFLRKMPSVAMFPIIMAVVGIGLTSQIVSVVVAVALLVAIVTAKAVSEPDPAALDIAKLMRLTMLQRAFLVFLPSRLGPFVTSAKSAMQLALLLTILGETFASTEGIGAYMLRARSLFDIELMWIGIAVVGIIGFLLHELFDVLERTLIPDRRERENIE